MIRKLALRQLLHRPVTTLLLILVMAFSIGISVFLSTLHQGLHDGLTKATEPFSLLVSSPGSQHQLVLTSIFLQDRPLPNLPYEEVEALNAKKKLVQFALPLAFGDSYEGYRIVGSTAQIFSLKVGKNAPAWLSLKEGRAFEDPFEAVIGSDVAIHRGLKLGDAFTSIHGLVKKGGHAHKDNPYTVVGILNDVQGPYNQVILTSIESVWEAHAHHDHHEEPVSPAARQAIIDRDRDHEHDKHEHDEYAHIEHEHEHEHEHDQAGKEVSAIIVEPVGYSEAYQLASQYQSRKDAMLVFPAQSIVQLFNLMGRGEKMWQPVGVFLMILSILIVVMTSYLSSLSRLREYAIMRALGATTKDISYIFMWQNTFLVLGGTIGGSLLGMLSYALLSHAIASSTALSLPLSVSPLMGILLIAMVVIALIISLIPMKILKSKLSSIV
ncbi:MAG: FtsX-like permease family protein [Dialister sp.]|nr:FtsX-like permease family protein [Dialister sp.]